MLPEVGARIDPPPYTNTLVTHLPEKRHTDEDPEPARTKGQVLGWVQGGGAVILGGIVLNLLGWLPAVLVLGAVA